MASILNGGLDLSDCGRFPHLLSGMTPRTVVTLQPGDIVFRFASSSVKPALARAAAPWWWCASDFEKMVPYLKMDPGNVGAIARMQGGVRYDWPTRVDVLIRARIEQPIQGFVGPGTPQTETHGTTRVVWYPPKNLEQLYLPNIARDAKRDPSWQENPLTETGQAALCEIRMIEITSKSFEEEWGIRLDQLHGLNVVMPGDPQWH